MTPRGRKPIFPHPSDRHGDRAGKSSDAMFTVINFKQAYDYVVWDL